LNSSRRGSNGADVRTISLALALAVSAKLVIATANGVTVTDYPSIERCEQARAALERAWLDKARAKVPSGYHLVAPPAITAVCIPA
jgi:hypothetical protein